MRKITLMLAIVCITLAATAQVVVTEKWSFSNAGGNLPTLPGGGTWSTPSAGGSARNFAVGTFEGIESTIIIARPGIDIYNAVTGAYVGPLNVSGIAASLVTVGDGDITEDGKLLIGNVASSAAGKGPFKVYMWDNAAAAPTPVITYAITGTPRLGDKLFIEGNYTTGTAKVYATNKVKGYSSVLCWSMIADVSNPGKFIFNQTPASTINPYLKNVQANITTIPGGGYYYKEVGTPLVKYSATGDSIAATALAINTGTNPVFVGYDGVDNKDEVIAYFRYYNNGRTTAPFPDAPVGGEEARVELLRVPGGDITLATSIAMTTSLGNIFNVNGWGDVHTKRVGDDVEVYVFSAYNGFAKYVIENVFNQNPGGGDPDPSVETVWSFSNAGGNLPTLPSGGTWSNNGTSPAPTGFATSGATRNFAVGKMGVNERVFLFTRAGTVAHVEIYNALTGAYVAELNATGVSGGTVSIGDGDVTEDGKLLMSNLALKATNPFKVYMWENETAAPEPVISYTITGTQRYGDKIFVEGDFSQGTAKVYATNKAAAVNPILCWSMIPDVANPGKFIFDPVPTEPFSAAGLSIQANMTTIPGGGFYYKESGKPLVKYDENGVHKGVSPEFVRLQGTTPRFVSSEGGYDIVAYFRYYHDATKTSPYPDAPTADAECRVELLRIPSDDITLAESIAITPSLGSVNNLNGWGDVVAKRAGKNVEVYALSGYNGFGKYIIKDVFLTTSVEKALDSNLRIINRGGQISVEGSVVSTIEIYNTMGQRVRSIQNTNEVNTGNLTGVHVVKVKFKDLTVKTAKVIL